MWDTIDTVPPSEDGKSKLKVPPKGALSSLKTLYDSGKWMELLENSEVKITNSGYLFCFDLTMYTAEALMNLGESYEPAGKALKQEILFLISRHPSLIEGAFSDGTPFAGSETREWIKNIGADSESALQVDSMPLSIDIAGSDIGEEIQQAITLAMDKSKLKEAVYSLQSNLNGSSSGKDAFLRRIGLAELLYSKNKITAAMPHAEMILKNIDEFSLDQWQPELALRGFKTALNVFGGLKDNKEKINHILKKISLLDATEVLEVLKHGR
jgi:type VI secretion system protein VasJ